MKMKKTSFIKIGVFVFSLSLFLWNCIREDFMNPQNTVTSNQLKYSLTKISYQELLADKEIKPSLPLIERRFSKHSPQSIYSRSATEVAEGLTIFTDEINRIVIDDVITWTFQTESPVLETSDFENFLVKKHNGVFTYFLVSYEFTDLTDSETLYEKATSYVISEEYLSLEGLNLSSRDAFDWVFPNDGGGTGSGPCESILVYDRCNLGGNADGHWPVLQNDGFTYCSGSPLLYIDFSHCENYGVPDPPVGDPPGGDDGSGGDQLVGGVVYGNPDTEGNNDNTVTIPVGEGEDSVVPSLLTSALELDKECEIDWVNDPENSSEVINLWIYGGENNWSDEVKNLEKSYLSIVCDLPKAKFARYKELIAIIENNPWALLEDCIQENGLDMSNYIYLYNHTLPSSCTDRLESLGEDFSNQPLSTGNAAIANVDYYGVEITANPDLNSDGMPDSDTQVYEAYRQKFTDLASGSKDDFEFSCNIPFNSSVSS
ncbi:MAG: hypothetical protein GKR88_12260 [Flavobacteriaceae bacterium]|nr:MAG: hypothetical protein GKR88_12260 [Flavobacteriaceae bacterium]